ncbi:MAG: methionyl-tRNA formyltransferase [Syntrophobacteraceae bacterium]|nr:methionyl-tRNA formyltransferase [Syntrophobacteraceae bacterium]
MEEKAKRSSDLNADLPPLIFLGTPDFAVPSLKQLAASKAPIRMVVTQPDRPSGRGKKVTAPPVKVLAEQLGIPVFQPQRVKGDEVLDVIRAQEVRCAVVVAFGQILPRAFLDLFPRGVLNVHGSLLPKYRGAAPVQRAILAGESVTGVSIMLLDEGMDTGPVLAERDLSIARDEAFGSVYDRMAKLGADLLVDTLRRWHAGTITPRAQDESRATYAPPVRKEELSLDWTLPARNIVNKIRAFDPWPGAYALFGGKRIKCFDAKALGWRGDGAPGEVAGISEEGIVVFGGDGHALAVGALQAEGRDRLPARDFLRGRRIAPGSRLE